jgi:hypothetical protein
LSGRSDCPDCQGKGFLVDPDPRKSARACACTQEVRVDEAQMDLPARYREADFVGFWRWWKGWEGTQKQQRAVVEQLSTLEELLATPEEIAGVIPDRPRLEKLVLAAHQNLQHGTRPLGAEDLYQWATRGKHRFRQGWELWHIFGPPQSGKSTLAVAALRAWSERTGRPGRFLSARTLSQKIKNAYYDVRSFQNTEFVSVRDLMEPLKNAPCVVLDEWDCLDGDSRVASAFAEWLTYRYHENLPTILTANLGPLELEQRENWAFARHQDASLSKRLEGAERVQMVPALAPWLKSF